MVTTNIDIDYRLINGQIDAVCKIATDSHGKVSKIYLKLDEDKAGLKLISSDDAIANIAKRNKWVASIKLKVDKDSSPSIKRTQFPLRFSFHFTVHKVQGLSLEKAVISFDLTFELWTDVCGFKQSNQSRRLIFNL